MPGFTSTLPEESVSLPSNVPFESNALMVPSPKLETRISLAKVPKLAGAFTTPQGALRSLLAPAATKVLTKLPLLSKISTCPAPAPGTASCLGRILHRVGDVDLVTDDVDAVGSVAHGKVWIGERAAQRSEVCSSNRRRLPCRC